MTAAADSPGLIRRIGQIAIPVRDLDRAMRFYRGTLKLRHLFSVPPKMSFFECGGVRLMLSIPEAPEFEHPASILYYQVDDLPRAHAQLRDCGVTFTEPPHLVARLPDHELWMAGLRDSEDNRLVLMAEVR